MSAHCFVHCQLGSPCFVQQRWCAELLGLGKGAAIANQCCRSDGGHFHRFHKSCGIWAMPGQCAPTWTSLSATLCISVYAPIVSAWCDAAVQAIVAAWSGAHFVALFEHIFRLRLVLLGCVNMLCKHHRASLSRQSEVARTLECTFDTFNSTWCFALGAVHNSPQQSTVATSQHAAAVAT